MGPPLNISLKSVTLLDYNSSLIFVGEAISLAGLYGVPWATVTDVVYLKSTFDTFMTGDSATAAAKIFAGADTVIGNRFNDILEGFGGDDTLTGGKGNDTVIGGAGTDTAIFSGKRADYAVAIAEDGTVTVADQRVDADGADTLVGVEAFQFADGTARSLDVLATVPVAPTAITLSSASILENSAGGTVVGTLGAVDANGGAFTFLLKDPAGGRFALKDGQIVVADGATIDFETAASHAVTLQVTDNWGLTFEQTLTITVTDAVEALRGTGKANKLVGGSGSDILYGLGGKDVLSGKSGRDVFVFNTKPGANNVDKITDFNVKDDTIWLDNKIFAALGKKGSELKPALLKKAFFTLSGAAGDADDHLVYDNTTGALSYDADGNGASAPIRIATLKAGLKLTYKDFYVV
ncbi:hypothetical protein [Microvirga pudoricolor]|uniref:hypothetical protein n=1 Tax=Microvirga pudoricolor TaxID=2778729 RepID=UPI00194E83AE|nr:hypothetical protein [Microvirga pudoricolor]MBM6595616.1 hypothetical protein [Microvirga pudoricolor]